MNTIKPAFQSSIDPTEISHTIQSGSKTVIGLIGFLVALKGVDAVPITTQLQMLVDTAVTVIPASFAMWHGMQTLWGLVRKMFVEKV